MPSQSRGILNYITTGTFEGNAACCDSTSSICAIGTDDGRVVVSHIFGQKGHVSKDSCACPCDERPLQVSPKVVDAQVFKEACTGISIRQCHADGGSGYIACVSGTSLALLQLNFKPPEDPNTEKIKFIQ